MGIAREIAKRTNALRYEDFPAEAIHWSKVAIADTIGVALAGSREDSVRITEKILSIDAIAGVSAGPSLIWGRNARRSALDAALINGCASHALDYDDTSNTIGGHPTAPVLPAALALGEEIGASGRDVIEAYVASFETQARLAQAVQIEHYHYKKGWHPTMTLGIFGAAAACGRLLELTDDELATAYGLCVSSASGVKANFGTMTKPLHAGLAARGGLLAALLAREGFTASAEAFEHKQGFFEVFNGVGAYAPEKALENWCDPLDVVEPAMGIKRYPCCGSTQSAVDAAIGLRGAYGFTPDQIAKVETRTHERRLAHTDRPDPKSPMEAKFSVQYCVALALIHGTVVLEHFEGRAYLDERVCALMARIEPRPHTDDNHYGSYVAVTLKDGTVVKEYVQKAKGRGPDHPLSVDELRSKFAACASRALPADRVERLYAALGDFENLESVRDITAIMEWPGGVDQAAD